jgi:hypothetical protein
MVFNMLVALFLFLTLDKFVFMVCYGCKDRDFYLCICRSLTICVLFLFVNMFSIK